ncbi:MAG: InlB B-repeat-containing protein [Firmicutes bacterium]|nr:InlB B-repeat-containing protein [[Eubacterium] siraeum]MCM1486768.1 InlB B-repeat-containing protein [Bacillota bacterium]
MKTLTKKLVSIVTAAAFTAGLTAAMPSPAVDAQIIHWQHSEFDSWDDPNELPSSGSYLLESDVTLHHSIIVTDDLNLCLNGHNIVFKIAPDKDHREEKTYGFFLVGEADLNIYAEESGGKIITQLCGDGEDREEAPAETATAPEEAEAPESTSDGEITDLPDSTSAEDNTEAQAPDASEETAAEGSAAVPEETEAEPTASPEEEQPEETAETDPVTAASGEEEPAESSAESTEEPKASEDFDTEESDNGQAEEPAENTSTALTADAENGGDGLQEEPSAAEDSERETAEPLPEENLALHIRSFSSLFKAEPETGVLIEDSEDIEDGEDSEDGGNNSNKDNGDDTDSDSTDPQPDGKDGEIISDPVLISNESSGELNLYGGALETEGEVCIVSGEGSTVNIYGGTITACDDSPIAVCARGDLRINDGAVNGGIEFDGGQLTVSGGRILNGVNIIGGSAVISGGLITGENAAAALSDKNVEIDICNNAVLAGDSSALNILNENARVYLYGEPALAGDICIIPSETADNTVLHAHCRENGEKIYTGRVLNIALPDSGEIFNAEIDGKYVIAGVSEENKDKFAVEQEYYILEQEADALRLKSELVKITEIYLEDAAMEINTEIALAPVILPENYHEKIIWSSSDPDIASVDGDGRVSAHRVGAVTITAAAHTDQSIFASCEIEVTSSKVYNILFDTRGVNTHISEKYKRYVYGETTLLPIPEAVGYSFVGWHRSPDLDDEILTEIGPGESGDIVLYAQWSTDEYGLEFVLNGGEFDPEDNIRDSYVYGSQDVLPVPVKEGFKFMGWYENEDLSDSAVYKIPADSAGNKIYYAKWVENDAKEYSVIFRVDGSISVVVVYEGEIPQYPKGTPVKASDDKYDYEFAGWSPEIAPAYDFNVYEAKFNAVPKSFDITLDLDGGTIAEQEWPSSYTYGDNTTLPIPEKEGFSFIGWYTDGEFSGDPLTEVSEEEFGDKLFFAKWALNEEKSDEDKENGAPEEVEISDEVIDIVWPANAKVILNPYKMKLSESAAAAGGEIIENDVSGITDTVVSPELKFINKSNTQVKIIVSGSVDAVSTVTDSDGMEFSYESRSIDFATAPINPDDRNNTILLYLEQAYEVDPFGTGLYSQGFDADNSRQMLLGKETVTRELFTIPASENEEGTRANVKICGDMALNPILSWSKLAETDSVNINLLFTAVPESTENKGNAEDNEAEEGDPEADGTEEGNPAVDSTEEGDPEASGSDNPQNPENGDTDKTDTEDQETAAEAGGSDSPNGGEPDQGGADESSEQDKKQENGGEGQAADNAAFKEPDLTDPTEADGTDGISQ